MEDMERILAKEIRRLQERSRDLTRAAVEKSKALHATQPEGTPGKQRSDLPSSRTPDGKPLKEAASTAVLQSLARGCADRLRAEAEAREKAAPTSLPPWHNVPFPSQQQSPQSANAEALARIAARVAEELANLVTRAVGMDDQPSTLCDYSRAP